MYHCHPHPCDNTDHAPTLQPSTTRPCSGAAHHSPHLLNSDTVIFIVHPVEVEARGSGIGDPTATGRDAAAVDVLRALEVQRGQTELVRSPQPGKWGQLSEGKQWGAHSGPQAPAQPYLALELHKVLRHAAQGKDVTILSWVSKKPHGTSVMVAKPHGSPSPGSPPTGPKLWGNHTWGSWRAAPRENPHPSPASPKAEPPRAWPNSTGSTRKSWHMPHWESQPCPGPSPVQGHVNEGT